MNERKFGSIREKIRPFGHILDESLSLSTKSSVFENQLTVYHKNVHVVWR